MSTITIYRGSTLIADGDIAKVVDCPLGACEHMLDVVALVRAATISVFDRFNKRRAFALKIRRTHASNQAAMIHAMQAPQISTGRFDFKIWFDDGTDIHKFTSTNAGWGTVTPESCSGISTVLSYAITCPAFVYTKNGDASPITYSDAL